MATFLPDAREIHHIWILQRGTWAWIRAHLRIYLLVFVLLHHWSCRNPWVGIGTFCHPIGFPFRTRCVVVDYRLGRWRIRHFWIKRFNPRITSGHPKCWSPEKRKRLICIATAKNCHAILMAWETWSRQFRNKSLFDPVNESGCSIKRIEASFCDMFRRCLTYSYNDPNHFPFDEE